MAKRELVDDEQMTGGTETCIDGTVRTTPVAEIEIERPYCTGKVDSACVPKPA